MRLGSMKWMILFLTFTALACQNGNPVSEGENQAENKPTGEVFGEAVSPDGAIGMNELAGLLEKEDSVEVTLTAEVEAVCQMKGCWMNLVAGEGQEEVKVRFKDYGFFVPKDIAGRQVVVHGVAFKEMVSVEDLKHYAEDEGKPQEEIDAITEPEEKWSFMADGVLLLDDQKETR